MTSAPSRWAGPPAAVVLGTSMTALPLVRSLGRRGVPVIVCDVGPPDVARYSRYVRRAITCDTESALMGDVLSAGLDQDTPSILFATSDEYLLLLSRNRGALHPSFRYPFPPTHSLDALVGKRSLADLFRQLGIPAPRSVYLPRNGSPEDAAAALTLPVIVKPNLHDSWLSSPLFRAEFGYQKVMLVERAGALVPLITRLLRFDDLILQEYVPGASSDLYYFLAYRTSKGAMLGTFLGRKHRTLPERLGTEVLLESVRNEDAERAAIDVLERLDYVGIAGVDLKYDHRDATFKIIEVNFRFGSSDGLAAACGLDLPYLVFSDLLGKTTAAPSGYRCGVFWNWLERDIDWLRDYRASHGLSLPRWLWHHATHQYHYPYFAADDPAPWLMAVRGFLGRIGRRAVAFSEQAVSAP